MRLLPNPSAHTLILALAFSLPGSSDAKKTKWYKDLLFPSTISIGLGTGLFLAPMTTGEVEAGGWTLECTEHKTSKSKSRAKKGGKKTSEKSRTVKKTSKKSKTVCTATHPEFPRHTLRYEQGNFSGLYVDAETLACSEQPGIPNAKGIDIHFKDQKDKYAIAINGLDYPLTDKKAIKEGYIEGGCASGIGGPHYAKSFVNDIESIYDSYGTKEITGFSVRVNIASIEVGNTKGFDFSGLRFRKDRHCIADYCVSENDNCVEDLNNCEKEMTMMHVLLFNQQDPSQYKPCQVPLTDDSGNLLCQIPPGIQGLNPCTCCGTEKEPSGLRTCPPPLV